MPRSSLAGNVSASCFRIGPLESVPRSSDAAFWRCASGEPHHEAGAAVAAVALGPHASAVCLDDRPRDREPDAATACRSAACGIDAEEPLEDALEVLRRDAFTRVGDGDLDIAASSGRSDLDQAAARGVPQRVLDEVVNSLI